MAFLHRSERRTLAAGLSYTAAEVIAAVAAAAAVAVVVAVVGHLVVVCMGHRCVDSR